MHLHVERRSKPGASYSYSGLALLLLVVVAMISQGLEACGGGGGKKFGKGFKGKEKWKPMKGCKMAKSVGSSLFDHYKESKKVKSHRYIYDDDDYEPAVRRLHVPRPRQEVIVRHEYPSPSYHMMGDYEPMPARRYAEDRLLARRYEPDRLTPMRYETERPSIRKEIGRAFTDALVRRMAVA